MNFGFVHNAYGQGGEMFYTYIQNNSGGSFDFNERQGITRYVIVEAESEEDADKRARDIGLYFNGCALGLDCNCCGDRWHCADKFESSSTPTIYGYPIDFAHRYMPDGKDACVHYADGRKEWY